MVQVAIPKSTLHVSHFHFVVHHNYPMYIHLIRLVGGNIHLSDSARTLPLPYERLELFYNNNFGSHPGIFAHRLAFDEFCDSNFCT